MEHRHRRGGPGEGPGRLVDRIRGGCAHLKRTLRDSEATRRAKAILMTGTLALSSLLGAISPVVAYADPLQTSRIDVTKVADDELELPGYDWSLDFEEVEVVSGWQETDDIGQYVLNPTGYDGKPGFAAPITDYSDDMKGKYVLRYTGGEYDGNPLDAIVTLEDWVYDDRGGWENYPHTPMWRNFQPGVYVIRDYKSPSDKDDARHQTFNFYILGLDDLKVSVKFVHAGTDQVMEMRGHISSTDTDVEQAISYGGPITEARIGSDNDVVELNPDGTYLQSKGVYLDDQDPEEYRKGIVETYFDTYADTYENGPDPDLWEKPLEFYFRTSWAAGGTCESIFFLTTELLTSLPGDEKKDPPTKSVDKTEGVSVDDTVTYTVDYPVHTEGVDCRIGWKYTRLDLIDNLPPEMRYVEGSGHLVGPDGSVVEGAGRVIYEGDNENPTENTVRFEFDPDFLQTMEMQGEHYKFVFDAVLTEYPAGGELHVDNSAYALVNNTDKIYTGEVTTQLIPPVFEVDKSADTYEYEVGDVITYTVTYRQTAKNAQSRETIISDDLPEFLELIPESVSATGIKDLPAPVIEGNKWSIDFDKFNYGDELTVTYQARVRQSGNGEEIVNNAAIHANNAMDADDPEEIYANTANVEIVKDVDRYEGYVGASDQDPGFFEYTVTFRNTQEGTVANNVVITDDSLPEGMKLGRNNDGSLMIMSVTQDGGEVQMVRDQDQYSGTLANIQYRVGEADGQSRFDGDFVNDQTVTITPTWEISPKGTGWEMHLDHLAYGTDVTLVYRAYPEDSVSGWEIENVADISADNSLPDEDEAIVWVNQPHFAIDKQASNDTFTVNDEVLYEVKVTNSTPGTLARNVVISDLAHTQGVELLHDTIMVYDSEGRDITDSCTISYKHNPYDAETFIVETHRDLIAGMTDEMRDLYEQLMACTDEASFDEVYAQIRQAVDEEHKGADHDSVTVAIPGRPVWRDGGIVWLDGSNPLDVDQQSPRPGSLSCETEFVVCYRVKINDAELAGQTVDNTALVVSDEPNTATTDDEVVDVKGPRLVIDKSSDKEVYQVGETGHYTLVATQTREDNVAKDVVISDLMDERDVASIVHGSVKAVGPDGQAIDAEPAYVSDESGKIVGFTLETGTDLADEESITVTYDVIFEQAGTTLHNVAQDNAQGAIGGTDDNLVKVVDPYATVTLTKSVDRETVRFMEWATYTLTAEIADNPAKNVVISDMSLPDEMPIDMDSIEVMKDGIDVTKGSLDWDGNGFAAHVGDCDAGCVITITYRAQVRDRSLMGTSVVNTATLTSDTLEEPLRDDAHVTIPLEEPDVTLDKTVDRTQIEVGDKVTYTVRATVAQDAEGVTNVVIGDASLPDAMHIDMASIRAWVNDVEVDPVNADISGNTFKVPLGDLRAGETVTITYDATATDESLEGTDVVNVATLTSDSLDEPLTDDAVVHVGEQGEPDPDPDPGTDPEPGGDTPLLTISKDSNKSWYVPGETGRYTLRVTNPAEGTVASDVVVTDELDGDDRALAQIVEGTVKVTDAKGTEVPVSAISYDKSDSGRTYGFTIETGYDLSFDGALYVTYDVSFDGKVNSTEDVHNLATASSSDGPTSEADHTVNLDTEAKAELRLEKSADKASVAPGDELTYTVRVWQPAEGMTAEDVVVTDDLPDGYTLDQDSVKVERDGHAQTANAEFPAGKLRVSLGDVAYGETWTITYSGTVDEDFLGDELTNTVLGESANVPEEPEDETTTPVTNPRLEIEKTADKAAVKPGDDLTWEITVTQVNEDAVASGVIVTDSLPKGFTADASGVTVADAQGAPRKANVSVVNGKLTAVLGDLAYNDPLTISVRGTVTDCLDGDSLVNVAEATSTTTPDPVRDSETVPVTDTGTAIVKRSDSSTVEVGDTISYQVIVTAGGDLEGAVVTDEGLPSGAPINEGSVTVSVNDETLDDVTFDLSGNSLTFELGDLSAGDVVTIAYEATVTDESLAGTSLTNVATLDADNLDEPLTARRTVHVADPDDDVPSGTTGTSGGGSSTTGGGSYPNTGQAMGGVVLIISGLAITFAVALRRFVRDLRGGEIA